MLQNLRKQQKGFTIIEVMIVLVIAAVIILIVFLAVPALQRNQRNTSFKNAIGAVLAGTTEFTNINNGQTATGITQAAGSPDVQITGGAGTTAVTVKVQGGYTFSASTTAPATGVAGTAAIAFNRKCNTAGTALDTATTNRSVAALYNLETTGQTAPQCQAG